MPSSIISVSRQSVIPSQPAPVLSGFQSEAQDLMRLSKMERPDVSELRGVIFTLGTRALDREDEFQDQALELLLKAAIHESSFCRTLAGMRIRQIYDGAPDQSERDRIGSKVLEFFKSKPFRGLGGAQKPSEDFLHVTRLAEARLQQLKQIDDDRSIAPSNGLEKRDRVNHDDMGDLKQNVDGQMSGRERLRPENKRSKNSIRSNSTTHEKNVHEKSLVETGSKQDETPKKTGKGTEKKEKFSDEMIAHMQRRIEFDYNDLIFLSDSRISVSKKRLKFVEQFSDLDERLVARNFDARLMHYDRESETAVIVEGNCIYKKKFLDFAEEKLRVRIPDELPELRLVELRGASQLDELITAMGLLSKQAAIRRIYDPQKGKYSLLLVQDGNPYLLTDKTRKKNIGYLDSVRKHESWGIFANNTDKLNGFDLWVRKLGPFSALDDLAHAAYLRNYLASVQGQDLHPYDFYTGFNAYLEDATELNRKPELDKPEIK